jgi:hypothetical protein
VLWFTELSGTVNIASGGATTAITDSEGLATIFLAGGSGSGSVAVCAGDTPLCPIQIRTPDVAGTPTGCALPTSGTSFVNAADIVNPTCGFLAKFGPVTPGVNDGWDLTCDGSVNALDVTGVLGKGGVLQHFGHGAALGSLIGCPP